MDFDVLIIGSGLGGLSVALSLPTHLSIGMVCKQAMPHCASDQAQGGMAAVLANDDSFAAHIADTLNAGADLCDPAIVAAIISAGPSAIQWLQQQQVPFTLDQDTQTLHLTREGGHGQRRIVHAADQTGHVVTQTLQQALAQRPNIHILEHHQVYQLTIETSGCTGALAQHNPSQNTIALSARDVVLASGGMGQLFALTTNPNVATADGLALAWRAGCRVANLEFMQFHPTALALKDQPTFLISEALRGEGALLRRPDGHRFMLDHDPRAELAPRDIVAKAIVHEMQTHRLDHVHLDISHKGAAFIQHHFPTIAQRCREYGIDINTMPIPVAPAAHYACGGVYTDAAGHTDVAHLYAAGEVAYTGLHGANRLASNSLLECVVVGRQVAQNIAVQRPWPSLPTPQPSQTITLPPMSQFEPSPFALTTLKTLMSRHLGVCRSHSGMSALWAQLQTWAAESKTHPQKTINNHALLAARLMTLSALNRLESRGGHQHIDHPERHTVAAISLLDPQQLLLE